MTTSPQRETSRTLNALSQLRRSSGFYTWEIIDAKQRRRILKQLTEIGVLFGIRRERRVVLAELVFEISLALRIESREQELAKSLTATPGQVRILLSKAAKLRAAFGGLQSYWHACS